MQFPTAFTVILIHRRNYPELGPTLTDLEIGRPRLPFCFFTKEFYIADHTAGSSNSKNCVAEPPHSNGLLILSFIFSGWALTHQENYCKNSINGHLERIGPTLPTASDHAVYVFLVNPHKTFICYLSSEVA